MKRLYFEKVVEADNLLSEFTDRVVRVIQRVFEKNGLVKLAVWGESHPIYDVRGNPCVMFTFWEDAEDTEPEYNEYITFPFEWLGLTEDELDAIGEMMAVEHLDPNDVKLRQLYSQQEG